MARALTGLMEEGSHNHKIDFFLFSFIHLSFLWQFSGSENGSSH